MEERLAPFVLHKTNAVPVVALEPSQDNLGGFFVNIGLSKGKAPAPANILINERKGSEKRHRILAGNGKR